MVPDKQQKVEIYIMNGVIVLRLLSDAMLREILTKLRPVDELFRTSFLRSYWSFNRDFEKTTTR